MKVKINVTQEHIKRGKRKSAFCCAVAYAIAESIGHKAGLDETEIHIYSTDATDLYSSESIVVKTPKSVRDFIEVFDEKKSAAKPFTFNLNIPDEFLKEEVLQNEFQRTI